MGAVFAALMAGLVMLLLVTILSTLARGVTGYELRRLRRSGAPAPPMRVGRLVHGVRCLCTGGGAMAGAYRARGGKQI